MAYFQDLSIITFLFLAVFFDLSVRKIPNWLILGGLLAAGLVNASHGTHALFSSLLGFIASIGVLLVPFALRWLGAGDVKAFGVVGALLGPASLPLVAFYTALAAGLIGIGYMVVNQLHLQGFKGMWTDFRLAIASFGHILPEHFRTNQAKQRHYMPWAVSLGTGTIIAYYLDPQGRWAGF